MTIWDEVADEFKTAREAAAAYNAAAIIIHGEFAILNQLENLGG